MPFLVYSCEVELLNLEYQSLSGVRSNLHSMLQDNIIAGLPKLRILSRSGSFRYATLLTNNDKTMSNPI